MLAHAIYELAVFQKWARDLVLDDPKIWLIILVYIVLIAIPFVPGAELGLLLIAAFGPPIVGHVYLATVLALTLSFTIGRCLPERMLRGLLSKLDAQRLLQKPFIEQSRAKSWANGIARHRCCALIVLINTPGNSILGGGGGLALAAGASRFFSWSEFLFSILIAVAPLPVLILLTAMVF